MKKDRTHREELESRRWGICTTDTSTLGKMFEVYYSFGPMRPIEISNFYHSLFKNESRKRYNVPFAVVEYLSENRQASGYEFLAFSKIRSSTPWRLYKEECITYPHILGKIFSDPIQMSRGHSQSSKQFKTLAVRAVR